MMKMKKPVAFWVTFIATALLAACAGNNNSVQYVVITATSPALTSTSAVTATPDPCAPENLQTEVLKVHKYMREFDDASSLATSRPRDQLADAIANLQSIRREAEDQSTPSCVANLRSYQISHMNAVINTLIAFMGGSDQKTVDQGISIARQQHDQYTLELARLLGQTVVPVAPPVADTPAPTP